MLLGCRLLSSQARLSQHWKYALPYAAIQQQGFASKAKSKKATKQNPAIRKNEEIRFASMRVVFKDDETGSSEWKIMKRKEALLFAKQHDLDLVLVNGDADPPVCKLENFGRKIMDLKKKQKEAKAQIKARSQKEMIITTGIESRDLQTKMDKVHAFLEKGHHVRVCIIPKKFTRGNRYRNGVKRDRMEGFDETVLMFLESIDGLPIQIQEQTVKAFASTAATSTVANAAVADDSQSVSLAAEGLEDDDVDGFSDEDSEAAAGSEGSAARRVELRALLRRDFLLIPKRQQS